MRFLFVLICLLFAQSVSAAPGDILFSDDFERSTLGADWTSSSGSAAGIDTHTSSSPTRAMYTRHQNVTVTSRAISLLVPGARLNLWIRRGADSFSEDPDTNEDLRLEFLRSDASWQTLATYPGNGSAGEILTPSFTLPLTALHNNFRIRITQTGGSGSDWDYWHIDDVTVTETSFASTPRPLMIGNCDDFENGMDNWSGTNNNRFGTSIATSQSPTTSMHLNSGVVTVTSIPINTLGTFNTITVWVRRGADSFSENPDSGENLVVEYFNNAGSWVALETFTGSGAQGQIFNRTYNMPAAASHANFRVRFRMTSGSGAGYDYWHIDDLCLNGSGSPNLSMSKTVVTESDPINGTTNPKAIPGAEMLYTISVSNSGNGAPDTGTFIISDTIESNLSLFVGDLDGSGSPIRFVDGGGINSSGLSFVFTSLGSTTDDIVFLDSLNNPITPVDAGGYDSDVRAIQITPSGTFNAAFPGSTPSFSLQFRVRVD